MRRKAKSDPGKLPAWVKSARVVARIPVKSADGDTLVVCEMELIDDQSRTLVQFCLEAGKAGNFVDGETFVVSETGQRYRRIDLKDAAWPPSVAPPPPNRVKSRLSDEARAARERRPRGRPRKIPAA